MTPSPEDEESDVDPVATAELVTGPEVSAPSLVYAIND